MSDFHTTEHRVAAKDHTCEECSRTISKGERHEFTSGRFDGYMYSIRMCAHCRVAWRRANDLADAWDFIGVGDLAALWDEWAAGDAAALRLVVGMKRRWRDSNGRLVPVPEVPA